MSDLQTPLARARGLGSAKEGVTHWWRQRLTGVLMLPLVFILTLGLASLPGAGHAEFAGWVAAPFNTVCLVLFIGGVFYHAQLGLQVIIEDYVSNHATRTVAIVVTGLLCLVFAVSGIVAVLKISLGA